VFASATTCSSSERRATPRQSSTLPVDVRQRNGVRRYNAAQPLATAMPSKRATTLRAVLVIVPCAAVLLLNASQYWPFISDDALISLRYASRLLEGHGLAWTDGPPVEGYSNLLWVLLTAGIGLFGVDLVAAVRGLGVIAMIVVLFNVAHHYASRASWRTVWLSMVLPCLFLSLSAPIAVWTIGGLEQPLQAALLALSIPWAFTLLDSESPRRETARWLSVVLGLLCLTRPDGPLFAVVAAVSVFVGRRLAARSRPIAHAASVLLGPILCVGGQLLFRLAYYGEVLPNTALVKISGSASHWALGVEYLDSVFRALLPFSAAAIVALAALLIARQPRARASYLATAALAWGGYVAFIGGDVFPAYRHAVPLVVLVAFVLAEAAWLIARQWSSRPRVFYPIAIAALLALVPFVRSQAADKWVQRAKTERWEWQCKDLALTLKQAFGPAQPLLAVTAAGCLPYWSELPALDMMGLSDYYLPRHRPESFGTGMVGHELGDGAYVLSRNPDLIVFDVGAPDPSWRSGAELEKLAEFHARFVPVPLRTEPEGYTATVFMNRYSDRIGVVRTPGSLSVPGYLFTGAGAVAVLNRGGKLVVRPGTGGAVEITLHADEASWSVDAAASRLSAVQSEVRQSGRALTITLRPTGEATSEIEKVVLTNASASGGRLATLRERPHEAGPVYADGGRRIAEDAPGQVRIGQLRPRLEDLGGPGAKQRIRAGER
jgi:arabinofuranosyltransferase